MSATKRFKEGILGAAGELEDRFAPVPTESATEGDGLDVGAIRQTLNLIGQSQDLRDELAERMQDDALSYAEEALEEGEDPYAIAAELAEAAPERLDEFASIWSNIDPYEAAQFETLRQQMAQARAVGEDIAARTAWTQAAQEAEAQLFKRHPDADTPEIRRWVDEQRQHGAPIVDDVSAERIYIAAKKLAGSQGEHQRATATANFKKQLFSADGVDTGQFDGTIEPPDFRLPDFTELVDGRQIEPTKTPTRTEARKALRERIVQANESVVDAPQGENYAHRMRQHFYEEDMRRAYGPNWKQYEHR